MGILIFGGTNDAVRTTQQLTAFLHQNTIHMSCIYSLAGLTKNPNIPDNVTVRTGGFSNGGCGVQGIIDYIIHRNIQYVFDCTHPYAIQISTHIHQALHILSMKGYNTRLYIYNRPANRSVWGMDSHVRYMDTIQDIVIATRAIQGTLFLALGGKDAPLFFDHTAHIVVRSMNFIHIPHGTCIVGTPPRDINDEKRVFDRYNFTAVICKDSGTKNGYHKVVLAKNAHIPVYMLSRPHIKPDILYNNSHTATDITKLVRVFMDDLHHDLHIEYKG